MVVPVRQIEIRNGASKNQVETMMREYSADCLVMNNKNKTTGTTPANHPAQMRTSCGRRRVPRALW